MSIAKTVPPYYAVIFTSRRTEGDNGYSAIAEEVLKLAENQPGFLGVESIRNALQYRIGIPLSRSRSSKKWLNILRRQSAARNGIRSLV